MTTVTAATIAMIASEKTVPRDRTMIGRTPRYSASSDHMLRPRVCAILTRPVAVSVDHRYRTAILIAITTAAFT